MLIIHKLDDFFLELFSAEEDDTKTLIEKISAFYTLGDIVPVVSIKDNTVLIRIPGSFSTKEKSKYTKLIALCEAKKFKEAKELGVELVNECPGNTEYHRVLGQVYSELGLQDEALNELITALKWNPKNENALLLVGNIFALYKADISTAMSYYNQVLALNSQDVLALNNIGAQLLKSGNIEEGKHFIIRALKVDPLYLPSLLALSMAAEKEGKFEESFEIVVDTLKKTKEKDHIYKKCLAHAMSIAKILVEKTNAMELVKEQINMLSEQSGKKIICNADDTIDYAAKIEIAENHGLDFHKIKYKTNYPAVEHLIMHELMHLQLILDARAVDANQQFIVNEYFRNTFLDNFKKDRQALIKKNYPAESIDRFLGYLFHGINQQIFNTPVDLFIEDKLHNNEPALRPFQFLSQYRLIQEGVTATTKTDIVDITPDTIVSKSKILNIIIALHYKDLYGVDLIEDFKATPRQLSEAERLFEEFEEYRSNKKPGEEYELIQHWAEDLDLHRYFELTPENPKKRTTIDDVLADGFEDDIALDASQERKMKKFIQEHSTDKLNMAVAMYMAGALQKLSKLPKNVVKQIAFEFATLGMTGIHPEKEGYTVPSFKDVSFTGYKALAYYYVSWAIALPEMVKELQMPFDKEYDLAKLLASKNL